MKQNSLHLLLAIICIITDAVNGDCEGNINKDCPMFESPNYTVHLPYPDDCHKFYKCDHRKACLFDCPLIPGTDVRLVFNPKEEVCDWPTEENNCAGNSQNPTEATSPSTASTTLSTASTSSTASTTSSTASTTSSTASTTSSTASTSSSSGGDGGGDGGVCRGSRRLPHETDCKCYYECVNDEKIIKSCYENNIFNPIVGACDQPKNYRCETTIPGKC